MAISVLIETYNSAKYLRKAIENVNDFDEVPIYDKSSSDDTLDIARAAGCNEFVINGNFRYGTIGYIDSVNIAIKNYFVIAKRHEECVMNKINEELMK